MQEFQPELMSEIRERFAHVDHCPFEGKRIYFENAGGALTLKSVTELAAKFAALPDNHGRDNPASREPARIIDEAREDMMVFLNASEGQVFMGETGTEVLFRMISNACMGSREGGNVIGSSIEHPSTRSAAVRWAQITGKAYISVPHNSGTGLVEASDYAELMTPETRVATILHTSPVTGMSIDAAAIANLIRSVSPDCFIIVDGIQHAAHGLVDIDSYGVDGYAMSPYKMFSRHGYGLGWISDRLTALPHDNLIGGPESKWELGTRDSGAFAATSEVIRYFQWLGSHFTAEKGQREQIVAAGTAIRAHEKALTNALIKGTAGQKGMADMDGINIIGGADNPRREGLISFTVEGYEPASVVASLQERGIRAHIRKNDYYSDNILKPLGVSACVRISLCHYNTREEVDRFLSAMQEILCA